MTLSSLLPGSKFVLKAGFHITLDDSLKLFLCDIDRSITTSHVQNVAIKRPQVIVAPTWNAFDRLLLPFMTS